MGVYIVLVVFSFRPSIAINNHHYRLSFVFVSKLCLFSGYSKSKFIFNDLFTFAHVRD